MGVLNGIIYGNRVFYSISDLICDGIQSISFYSRSSSKANLPLLLKTKFSYPLRFNRSNCNIINLRETVDDTFDNPIWRKSILVDKEFNDANGILFHNYDNGFWSECRGLDGEINYSLTDDNYINFY